MRFRLLAEQARIHFLRGNLYFPRGDIEGCLREHGIALELARRAGAAELEATALGGLGDAEYVRGRMISALDRFRECVELCERHGFGRIEVANRPMMAFTQWFAGDTKGALTVANTAIARAARVGHRRAEMIGHHAAFFCWHALMDFEAAVRHAKAAMTLAQQLFPQATIVRPSLAYGEDDHFFSRFAAMIRSSTVLPLIGGGATKFQPVFVGDVTAGLLDLLKRPDTVGKTYEFGGPQVYSFRALLQLLLTALNRQRVLIPIPFALAEMQARLLKLLPNPRLTRDQVRLLKTDKVVSGVEPTLGDLGVHPRTLEEFLAAFRDKYS